MERTFHDLSSVKSISYKNGGRGIRTPGTVPRTAVFKTAGFNRSPIPPISNCNDEQVRVQAWETLSLCTRVGRRRSMVGELILVSFSTGPSGLITRMHPVH